MKDMEILRLYLQSIEIERHAVAFVFVGSLTRAIGLYGRGRKGNLSYIGCAWVGLLQ